MCNGITYTSTEIKIKQKDCLIPYSGKLSREKTFTNFAIFQPSAKVFSTKF